MKKLKDHYSHFFKEFQIDNETGVLKEFQNLKFMTMPYIGSKYFNTDFKILFVGMDVGKDEKPGSFHDFEDRRKSIETDNGFNPHIAGTYGTALYFLKAKLNWEKTWDRMTTFSTFHHATKNILHSENENPLSHIALTNLHKFVTVARELRAGDENRKFLDVELEEKLFLAEIDVLEPNVIIFQGKLPSSSTLQKIKSTFPEIYLFPHPSNRKKNGRNPNIYVSTSIKL